MNCQVVKINALPSTFVRMKGMKGKRDRFITMTRNPNWRVKDNLLPWSASDRSDICARVFHLKLEEPSRPACLRHAKLSAHTHLLLPSLKRSSSLRIFLKNITFH